MKLAKVETAPRQTSVGIIIGDSIRLLRQTGNERLLTEILESDNPGMEAEKHLDSDLGEIPLTDVTLLAPIDQHEIWAAGVTYKRSKSARMEESETAASCYDRVYESPRPELFMKATPHRVVGPGQPLRIRSDSTWNVPEPELALVMNSRMELVGFTVGNDMSSRDIEGDNPLYLPQAKVYDQCAGLGPWITLAPEMPPPQEIGIHLEIHRGNETLFSDDTSVSQMARSFDELIQWLARDNSFPDGAVLMTGTGIVPDSSFTLLAGDWVHIDIDGIGRLSNSIVQGD